MSEFKPDNPDPSREFSPSLIGDFSAYFDRPIVLVGITRESCGMLFKKAPETIFEKNLAAPI